MLNIIGKSLASAEDLVLDVVGFRGAAPHAEFLHDTDRGVVLPVGAREKAGEAQLFEAERDESCARLGCDAPSLVGRGNHPGKLAFESIVSYHGLETESSHDLTGSPLDPQAEAEPMDTVVTYVLA